MAQIKEAIFSLLTRNEPGKIHNKEKNNTYTDQWNHTRETKSAPSPDAGEEKARTSLGEMEREPKGT